jgi:uncharacterized membrane protein
MTMYVAGGLLLVALSIPLILNKVKPNGLYGFRVSQTMENPEIWYSTNHYAGIWLLITGICTIVTAVCLFFIPGISVDTYAIWNLIIFSLVFGFGIFQCLRYMKKLSKQSINKKNEIR